MRRIAVLLWVSLELAAFAQSASAQSADVTVFRHANIEGPRLWLDIYNYGNVTAQNIQVALEIPAALTLHSIGGDTTQCDTNAVPVRCSLGDLGPNMGPLQLMADFRAPMGNATYTIRATATSDTTEGNPANNVVTHTFETRIESDLGVRIAPGSVRLDPGATSVFDIDIFNYRVTLPPGDLLLKFTASEGMTIERIEAPLWTCTIAGATAECRAPALDANCWCGREIQVTARSNGDSRGGEGRLEAAISGNLPDVYDQNDRAAAIVETYRHFVVSTNADAGEGSLRAAIEQANQSCSPAPCKILFDLIPEGTITPATALPAITADRVFLDGGAKITLDGTAAHHGLDVRTRCEAVVHGLTLRNFGDQGLSVTSGNCPDDPQLRRILDQRRVSGNTIVENFRGLRLDDAEGVLVHDNVISDNLRSGVWSWNGNRLFIAGNRIGRNGASGIFLGPQATDIDVFSNTIGSHPDMGVAVAGGATVIQIRRNAMSDNRGLGIDWGLDGMSPANADDSGNTRSNAPVLLSARYDAATDRTEVTATLHSAALGHYTLWDLDVYASDAPDGDGSQWIGTHPIYNEVPATFVMLLRGDHTGKWLSATSTRVRTVYLEPYIGPSTTSELSIPLRVP